MECPSCGFEVKTGSRQCEACGTMVETPLTDEMVSGKGDTGYLEYAFLAQSAQAIQPPPPPLPTMVANGHAKPSRVLKSDDLSTNALPPTNLVSSVCRNCQTELRAGARFCSGCGASVLPPPLTRVRHQLQQKSEEAWKALRRTLAQSDLPVAVWIALGATAACVLMSLANLLFGLRGVPPPVTPAQAHLISHLRSIEWLLLAILALVGGLYAKRRS